MRKPVYNNSKSGWFAGIRHCHQESCFRFGCYGY